MRVFLGAAFLGLCLMFAQPGEAAAQRWVPANPFPGNQAGYGQGRALPFLAATPYQRGTYWMNGFYNPYSGVYVGRVSGFSPRTGYYSGFVNMYQTPYGTVYNYVPSFHNADFFRNQTSGRNRGLGGLLPTY
ncbi:MAG TPA: hypothetical protein PKD86_02035 [Gemmatales bacterium]|nr:hypothetical protein [Gemmatales bacterium]HMP58108.1 hypothetical protein [Gemmatales bacterium]